jgi:hypothetical protein
VFTSGFSATSPNTPNSIEVTISGETFAANGLPFVPVNEGDPVFVDGWSVSFIHYVVVIGNIRLSPNALQSPWQNVLSPSSCADYDSSGCAAQRDGPYVIDLHHLTTQGANGFIGADGHEPAAGLFAWNAQDDGQPFDTNALYAFSYNTVEAQFPVTNVNLSDDEFQIYQTMVTNHWDKYVEATATYVGTCDCAPGENCPVTSAALKSAFDSLPTTFSFHFGWNDHTTSLNCINPFNGNMKEGDLANRGIQTRSNGAVVAQITILPDPLFWDKLKQDGVPLRLDPIAAWAVGLPAGQELDLATLADKPFLPARFMDGTPIPDRGVCQNTRGVMGYTMSDQADPTQVSLNLDGIPASNIAGLANFMAMSAQWQTRMNANGICYVFGQNAPDPWFEPDVVP